MHLIVLGGSPASPNPGQGCSGYLVAENDATLLVDCGPGILPELLRHRPLDRLDGIIITHLHQDHVLDLVPLRYGLKYAPGLQKRRVSVWLPPGGLRYLERLARVLSLDAESSETFFTETFALAEYDPDAPLTTAVGHVSFRRTRHWVPCWALRIEGQRATLVYLADTGWDDSLLPFARDADLLIVEATLFPDAEPAAREGHLDLLQAIRLATLSHARRTLITHYWNSPATVATLSTVREQFPGTVELAYPGLTIAVSPQGGEP